MLKRAALLVPRHTSPLIARCTWLALVMPARAAPADGRSATGCRRTSVAAQRPRPSVGVDGPRRHRACQNEVVADLKQRRPSVEQISRIGMDRPWYTVD